MTTDEQITRLTAEIEALKQSLKEKSAQREALCIEQAQQRHGIKTGDVVTYNGKPYRITRIQPFSGKPWAWGTPRLKSGQWSQRENYLYAEWEIVAPIPNDR